MSVSSDTLTSCVHSADKGRIQRSRVEAKRFCLGVMRAAEGNRDVLYLDAAPAC